MQVHIFVFGKVTGVFFRAQMSQEARRVGVSGWVRNVYDRPDIFGNSPGVEAVIQGEKGNIDSMIRWLHTGSQMSEVHKVVVEPMDEKESFSLFEIRSP